MPNKSEIVQGAASQLLQLLLGSLKAPLVELWIAIAVMM